MSEEVKKESQVPAQVETAPVEFEEFDETPASQEEQTDDGSMSLTAHLAELRSRLIKSLLAVGVGSCVSYYFIDDIMHCLTLPVGKLYFMHPSEAFFTYLKVALVCGFLLALPVIFYHIWRFFLPALTHRERMVVGIVVPASVILFFCGLAFAFFLVLPVGLQFLMGSGNGDLQAMFSVDKYFDFIICFMLPFGAVFELPLIITVLGKLGIITSAFLGKYMRIVIFVSFIIGAALTPPDVFTQTMVALPMIALYGVGYLIVKYILRK